MIWRRNIVERVLNSSSKRNTTRSSPLYIPLTEWERANLEYMAAEYGMTVSKTVKGIILDQINVFRDHEGRGGPTT